MKTNLDKIDYENIYSFSQEEFEMVMDFLQLTAEFWQDDGKLTRIEQIDAMNPYVVMKIFFKNYHVKWQFAIDDGLNIFDEGNFIPYIRDQSRLSMAWIYKAIHDKKFVIGLFLQLLKNGICLKCHDKKVDIPSFKTLSELKMKLAIKNGIDETPFKLCL